MITVKSVNWPADGLSYLYPRDTFADLIPAEPQPFIIIDDDEDARTLVEDAEGLDLGEGGPQIFDGRDLDAIFLTAAKVVIAVEFTKARSIASSRGADRLEVLINTTPKACPLWVEAVLKARGRRDGVSVYAPSDVLPQALRDLLVSAPIC